VALGIDAVQLAGSVERDEDDVRCWEGEERGLRLRGWSGELGHCGLVGPMVMIDPIVFRL
jgi:hypothetical protein